jgi:TatD DNase family protein
MWTDTHLHLDASEYNNDRSSVIQRAHELHVTRFVLPAIAALNFDTVKTLAHATKGAVYCLGIHPLWVDKSNEEDLKTLRLKIKESIDDPQFAGIGEIGLDGFVSGLDWNRQLHFFNAQLQLACDFNLPVIMHVRRAQDLVLKCLRIYQPKSGIAHAFNGSFQQANHFLQLNICLGFGGACTFTRALQLRRLAADLPDHAIVLETDGPDIPPAWINQQRNSPEQLPQIAQTIAQLRGISQTQLSKLTQKNSQRVLPALLSV